MKNFFSLGKWILVFLVAVFSFFAFAACGESCSHDNLDLVGDTATCEHSGIKTFRCRDCGKTIEKSSNQLEHDYDLLADTSTCVQSGELVYRCHNCSSRYTVYQSAKGHDYSGVKCKNCGGIDPEYSTLRVKYENNQFVAAQQFTVPDSISSYLILKATFIPNSTNVALLGGGVLYLSSAICQFYVSIYDNNNKLIASDWFAYGFRYGSYFYDESTTTATRALTDGEIIYVRFKTSLLSY